MRFVHFDQERLTFLNTKITETTQNWKRGKQSCPFHIFNFAKNAKSSLNILLEHFHVIFVKSENIPHIFYTSDVMMSTNIHLHDTMTTSCLTLGCLHNCLRLCAKSRFFMSHICYVQILKEKVCHQQVCIHSSRQYWEGQHV